MNKPFWIVLFIAAFLLFMLSIVTNFKEPTRCDGDKLNKCYGIGLDGYCLGYFDHQCISDEGESL